MKLCLRCNQYFEDASAICPTDSSPLEPVGDHPLIGALINDRYVVDSVIGKGSSGIVYKATRLLMQREVAVKVLHSYLGAESGALDRFLREARAASRLRHPHIINIWESGVTDDGQPYFVMDYLEGITIAQLLKDRGYLHPSRALLIIKQICEALTEAHNQSIVHRDIKPENIVLQESDYENGEDFVKVLDFGIADQPAGSGGKAKQRTAAGSPAYMSPEQCQGFELDFRSDVYSLGVVVFEMLTGMRPFSAPEVMQLFHMHVRQTAPTLGSVRPDLKFPAKLEAVVAQALAKKPEQRQQSIRDFGNDLEEACRGFEFGAVQPAAETVSASAAYVPEADKVGVGTGTGSHNFLEGPEFMASERLTADMRNQSESEEAAAISGEGVTAGQGNNVPVGLSGETPKPVPAAFSYSRSRSNSTFSGAPLKTPLGNGKSDGLSDFAPPPPPQVPAPPPAAPAPMMAPEQTTPVAKDAGRDAAREQLKEQEVERAMKNAKRASESFKEILASGDHAPFVSDLDGSLSQPSSTVAFEPPASASNANVSPLPNFSGQNAAFAGSGSSDSLDSLTAKPKNDVSKWAQKVLGAGKGSSTNVTPIGTGSSSSVVPINQEAVIQNREELKGRELERSKNLAEAANHLMGAFKQQAESGTAGGAAAFSSNAIDSVPPLSPPSDSHSFYPETPSKAGTNGDNASHTSAARADDAMLHPHTPTNVEPPALNEFAAEVDKVIDKSIVSASHEPANFETSTYERRRFEDPVHNTVEAENEFASEIDKKFDDAIIHTGEHSLSGSHAPVWK